MWPVLAWIEVFGVPRPITGYGVLSMLGVVTTVAFALRAAIARQLSVLSVLAVAGYTIVFGGLGAYATFVLVEALRTGDVRAAIAGGGFVFYGAVPTGLAAYFISCRAFDVPAPSLLDATVPGIALGHALGRVGCFLGGCCFGREHEGLFSVRFTDPLAPAAHPPVGRHPVQLYEAAGLVLLAIAFSLAPRSTRAEGSRALLYVIAYGVLRLFMELAFRGDAVRGVAFGLLSTSTTLALLSIGAAVVVYVRTGRAPRTTATR